MNTLENIDFENYVPEHHDEKQIIPGYAYADIVADAFAGKLGNAGVTLPWSKTHADIQLRPGEVTVWIGRNFSGKSLFLGQVLLGCLQQGERTCIASLEMKPHTTLKRMIRQFAMVNDPSEIYQKRFFDWSGDKLWFYDQQGSITAERMLGVVRYCGDGIRYHGNRIKVHHMVIDSLMKCGIGVDDYTKQKQFVNELCTVAMDTNTHVHLVVHQNKAGDEDQIGDRYSAKGASEITDQADNAFIIWRNRKKEREEQLPDEMRDKDLMQMHDAILRCDKQRHGEFSGDFRFWFEPKSLQYTTDDRKRPIDFMAGNQIQSTGTERLPDESDEDLWQTING